MQPNIHLLCPILPFQSPQLTDYNQNKSKNTVIARSRNPFQLSKKKSKQLFECHKFKHTKKKSSLK